MVLGQGDVEDEAGPQVHIIFQPLTLAGIFQTLTSVIKRGREVVSCLKSYSGVQFTQFSGHDPRASGTRVNSNRGQNFQR
ncbi:unnamed protein product [Calypogeia fissa]